MGQAAGGAGAGPSKPQVSSVTSLIGGSLSGVVTAALTQVRGGDCGVTQKVSRYDSVMDCLLVGGAEGTLYWHPRTPSFLQKAGACFEPT